MSGVCGFRVFFFFLSRLIKNRFARNYNRYVYSWIGWRFARERIVERTRTKTSGRMVKILCYCCVYYGRGRSRAAGHGPIGLGRSTLCWLFFSRPDNECSRITTTRISASGLKRGENADAIYDGAARDRRRFPLAPPANHGNRYCARFVVRATDRSIIRQTAMVDGTTFFPVSFPWADTRSRAVEN